MEQSHCHSMSAYDLFTGLVFKWEYLVSYQTKIDEFLSDG